MIYGWVTCGSLPELQATSGRGRLGPGKILALVLQGYFQGCFDAAECAGSAFSQGHVTCRD